MLDPHDDDTIPPGYFRVTQILKPFTSFDKVDPVVLARAADRGTRVHKYCQLYVQNLLIEKIDEDCRPYVESFIQWFDMRVERVLACEIRLSCSNYRITGKPDLLTIIKGDTEATLLDYKTPQLASPTWRLQTAAYRYLIRTTQGIDVPRRVCLILDKEGGLPKFGEHTEHETDERLFFNSVELFHFCN